MKNKKLFDRTVSILVEAYRNDMLEPNSICACAIGNLVAANMNYTIIKRKNPDCDFSDSFLWVDPTNETNKPSPLWPRWISLHSIKKQQISSTGYTMEEVYRIEDAFMYNSNSLGVDPDQDNLTGLLAVVDVLMKIHEADQETVDRAKALFVRA